MSKQIISTDNPLIKHLVRLRTSSSYRYKNQSLVLFGEKLIREIVRYVKPKSILTAGRELPPYECESHIFVSSAVIKKISGQQSPVDMVAEFPLPQSSLLEGMAPLLVLEGIQDPGNVGTLLRTALALGWGGVFFLPGCVDPFNDKVLSASRGALFFLPWQIGDFEELNSFKLKCYTADIAGRKLVDILPDKNVALLLSNEGRGPSDVASSVGEHVTIPMVNNVESLNVAVAGSIIMYKFSELINSH